MRCLIVGGNGFIGRHVACTLRNDGTDVLVADLCANTDAPYTYADLLDLHSLIGATSNIDVVVHLAWATVPKSSTDDPIQDVATNIIGSLNLFRACAAQNVKRVVFCSTGGAIYGIPQVLPITEDHPIEPLCPYGITKAAVEMYLKLYSRLHGIQYVILRPANAYGEGQNSAKGQGVIAACLSSILHKKPFIVWGDGTVVRDYVYVTDIARAISLAVNFEGANAVCNIGSGRGTSVNEVISLVSSVTGVAVNTHYVQGRPIDTPSNILDASRARSLLSWQPLIVLENGLQQQWDHLVNNMSRSSMTGGTR